MSRKKDPDVVKSSQLIFPISKKVGAWIGGIFLLFFLLSSIRSCAGRKKNNENEDGGGKSTKTLISVITLTKERPSRDPLLIPPHTEVEVRTDPRGTTCILDEPINRGILVLENTEIPFGPGSRMNWYDFLGGRRPRRIAYRAGEEAFEIYLTASWNKTCEELKKEKGE